MVTVDEVRELARTLPRAYEVVVRGRLMNWAVVRLAAIDAEEMRELVVDAWSTVVPKYIARQLSELSE